MKAVRDNGEVDPIEAELNVLTRVSDEAVERWDASLWDAAHAVGLRTIPEERP